MARDVNLCAIISELYGTWCKPVCNYLWTIWHVM